MSTSFPNANFFKYTETKQAMMFGISLTMVKSLNARFMKMKSWRLNAMAVIIWAKFTIIIWKGYNIEDKNDGGMPICYSTRVSIKRKSNLKLALNSFPLLKAKTLDCQCHHRSRKVCACRISNSFTREVYFQQNFSRSSEILSALSYRVLKNWYVISSIFNCVFHIFIYE